MVRTSYEPPTSRYGSHMGTCYHYPARASAWIAGGHRVEITAEEYPNLDEGQLVEKAVAILRAQTRRR